MLSRKSFSALLTGASLAALAATAGRVSAATTTVNLPAFNWVSDIDWLNIEGTSVVGTFTNSATISDGLGNPDSSGAMGVHVRDGAQIDVFVNNGAIFASDNGFPIFGNTVTDEARAAGLVVDGNVASTVNNGSIGAVAFGFDFETTGDAHASGFATGIFHDRFDSDDGLVADVDNHGAITVNAGSQATSLDGEAEAYTGAFGIDVHFNDHDAVVSSEITSDSPITVTTGAGADGADRAYASSWGDAIGQDFENVDGGIASVINNGEIAMTGVSEARVEGGYAYAETNADGIDQEIEVDQAAGLSAIVTATNAGSMTVSGSATASATYGLVEAQASAAGIEQDAYGGKTLSSVAATNLADLSVAATATVTVDAGTYIRANASAAGIAQDVSGGSSDSYGLNAAAFADNQASLTVAATASASGTYVDDSRGAIAFAAGIDQQVEEAASLSAVATNSASIDVLASASSDFVAGTYIAAGAFAVGVNQDVDGDYDFGGAAFASFVNSGAVTVQAESTSTMDYAFLAESFALAGGAAQSVYDVSSGTIEFENAEGASMDVSADAQANGMFALSQGSAVGVAQSVNTIGDAATANLTATNLGLMTVGAKSQAESTYVAAARAQAVGFSQHGSANEVTLEATNSGDLSVSAQAVANVVAGELSTPSVAYAYNTYVGGIAQGGGGGETISATASNTASIAVASNVQASASTYAVAGSFAFGVMQDVYATNASAAFSNSGVVSVASASEASADRFAMAVAGAVGVAQDVEGNYPGDDVPASAMASVINDDTIIAGAEATAGGLNAAQSTYAAAMAFGTGVSQYVDYASTGQASLTNSGTVAATGTSSATGDRAMAVASAIGYEVRMAELGEGSVLLTNEKTGGIWAIAEANADGTTFAMAGAEAAGVSLSGNYDIATLDIDAVNKGLIGASAIATATGNGIDEMAAAEAAGVDIYGAGLLAGTFKNAKAGVIAASATATSANGFASAVGIAAESSANGMLVLNKGLIAAYADGKEAMATGIRIAGPTFFTTSGPPGAPPPMAVATIENHGDIWAGISNDGGDTVLRGNAINTQDAPNAVTILLENDDPANIFGNIDISADDQIIVQNGTTNFDGVVNPDMVLEGGLTIDSKGKLVMLNENDVEGPSKAYVDAFKVGKKGTLQLNLTPDNSAGAFPTITANTANLNGKLKASYSGAFYGDTTVYEDVITSNGRTGKFAQVVDNSILLKTKAIYDADNNVDLKLKRVGFGDVPGLTRNQTAAGNGIEKVYGDLPDKGPFSDIVRDLFSLNGAEYAAAMDQLAGAEYAQLVQSVLGSTGQLNASITDRMDCSIETNLLAQGADARKGCFDPNKVQVWARVGGAWNSSDGDIEAPGYDETQTSIYIGGDYAISTNVFIGAVGGYFNSSMDFDDWGGRDGASMSYDGGQIALYGGYDDGLWYGRNILSYGFYSGDSRRDFGITSTPTALKGDFDTDVVSYYGEAGRRFRLMENVAATPFLGLGLASAGIDSFTEKDPNGTGAALRIRGADSSSVATTLGFRVNGKWGGFRPEATLAWQHEFADARQTVDMSYAGAPKGANFSVVSSDPGSDALIVGLGGSYSVSASSVITVRYDGTFWSGYNSQELTARWTTKF